MKRWDPVAKEADKDNERPFVTKGSRIRAQWFGDAKLVALAGVNPKFQVTGRDVTGVVRHVRGDHPVTPTVVRLYLDPEGDWDGALVRPEGCTCEREHVEVDPDHIVEVLA